MSKKLKTFKKSLSVFMVAVILFGTLGPAPLIFAENKKMGDNDLELKKLRVEQLEKSEELRSSDDNGKMKTFNLDESLKKTAETKQLQKPNYVEGEVLVKFKEQKINLEQSSGRMKAMQFAISKNLDKKEDIRKSNILVLKTKGDESVENMIERLKNDPQVEYVQPNFLYYPLAIDTNDTYKTELWGLDNDGQTVNTVTGTPDKDIDAPEAWEISEGAESEDDIIVAVIDTGVAYNHPDLQANMWDGSNCVDENGNVLDGCNHGYDYEDGDKTPLPTCSSHGTHIAGTIGAVKNNGKGIIGVAPNVKIMALKSSLTTADNISSINFAGQNEAKVINASWGDYFDKSVGTYIHDYLDQALYNAIDNFDGLFVAAAGNDSQNHDSGNLDTMMYPAGFRVDSSAGTGLDNIIVVAATDQNDNLWEHSDYGVASVDVGAPGVNIYSTIVGTNVFSEDFEGGTYKVGVGGTNNNWIIGSDGYSKVAYSDPFVPYDSDAYTWLMSADATDLSGNNISGATLSFTIWCDTPINATFDDYIYTSYYSSGSWHYSKKYDELQIYSDGGSSWTDNGYTGYYKTYTENISNYLSSDFKFSFDWHTDSSIDNNLGCTIDNVKITKYTDGSDENYDYNSGTSFAAPHVAGLAALIWGYDSELSIEQVKNAIINTGDDLPNADDRAKIATGKRINAYEALLSLTDTIPPIRDNGLPTGELAEGTTSTVISLDTDENATCRYSETAGTAYSSMTDDFSTTGETTHSVTVTGLADGQSYNYYVRCEDETGNPNTDDFLIGFSVTETENTPPVLDSIGNKTIDENDTLEFIVTATDSDIEDTLTYSANNLPTGANFDINTQTFSWAPASNQIGEYSNVHFEVSDGEATDFEDITVTVTDATPPVITLLGGNPIDLFIGDTYVEYGANATDNVGITEDIVIDSSAVDTNAVGIYEVTYNVSDMAGNPADEVIRTVNVSEPIDTVPPTITLLGNNPVNLYVGNTYEDAGATAEDNIDGDITENIEIVNPVDTNTIGTYTVTYNVSDSAGNSADEVTRTVIVSEAPDTISPTITLLGDNPVELFVGDDYTEYGATAEDNIDGDITGEIEIDDSLVDTSTAGIYEVTYNVSDMAGNPADEVIRIVNVSEVPDTTIPVITLLGSNPVNLFVGDSYTDTGATALDDVDGDITTDIVVGGDIVDTTTVGAYIITYNVSDSAGNPADEVIRTVIVSEAPDTIPPVRSNGSPTGALSAGTTQTTLSLITDEDATCKYSTTADTEYSVMTEIFDTTGTTDHSTLVTGLTNGNNYTYYIRCQDNSDNSNTDDYEISFSVSSPSTGGGGGGGGGGSTPPSSVSSSNNPLKVLSTQEGTLNQNLNNENKVKVEIPKGSIKSTTTFTASEGSLEEGDIPKDKIGAFLFNGLVFNIEAVDLSNNAVREFSEDLTITLTVPDLPDDTSSLELYYFDDESGEWVIITDIEFGDDTITFKVNHLTQFALFEISESIVKGISDVVLFDGDVARIGTAPEVYIIKIVGSNKYKRHIVSPEVFNSYGHLSWDAIKSVSSLDDCSLSAWVRDNTGPNETPAATDKVYEVNADSTMHWLNMTAAQFYARGGSDEAIYNVNDGELGLYTLGVDVMYQ